MMTVEPRRGVTPYQPREGAPVFLSDMIMELGFASKEHVEAAVETARSSGETVGRILVREGRLSEDQLARALAARYGLNHIDLAEFDVDASAANLLPPAAAQRYRAVPVEFEPDGSLLVAMADPSDSLALNDIAFMTKLEVHAAVAAENLIGDLVGRLPLPPSENRSSGFPTPLVSSAPTHPPPAAPPAPTESFAPPAPPAAPEAPPAAPSPPPVDNSAEMAALRAELESTNAALDDERSKHAASVAELRQELNQARSEQDSSAQGDVGEELEQARSELERVRGKLSQKKQDLEQARKDLEQEREEVERARREVSQKASELESARSELGQKGEELEHVRSELGHKSGELERARTDLAQKTGEVDQLRSDLEQGRTEVERLRSELEGNRGELAQARAELDQNRAELEEARAQVARAGEALRRLDELDEAEARVSEAHATVEKMRHDFELEREQHAATERDLRSLLATETQRHEALQEAQATMQKRVDALRTQNAALLDAYATAKRWSEEFARGAKELANTLEQPVLDDAVRAQQSPGDVPPADGPGRFSRDDENG
jgi:predicted  nucleic acid-binding Zn-ribbon protein